MKEHICNWIPRIKHYSLNLDDPVNLCNRPWVLTNDQQTFTRLVFSPGGKLLQSVDGQVATGTWELLLAEPFLLLATGSQQQLYSLEFLDEGLMILRLDGSGEHLLTFANQQIVSDLDVEKYLNLHYSRRAIRKLIESRGLRGGNKPFELELELADGSLLQLEKDLGYTGLTKVKVNGITPADGFYKLADGRTAYRIKNGSLRTKYYLRTCQKSDGTRIEIGYIKGSRIRSGCPVWVDGQPAEDGKYRIGWLSGITVESGKVAKVSGPAKRQRQAKRKRKIMLFNW